MQDKEQGGVSMKHGPLRDDDFARSCEHRPFNFRESRVACAIVRPRSCVA